MKTHIIVRGCVEETDKYLEAFEKMRAHAYANVGYLLGDGCECDRQTEHHGLGRGQDDYTGWLRK